MNNIDLFNLKEIEDNFEKLSSIYNFHRKYSFFFSPFFIMIVSPFFNIFSLLVSQENRPIFLILTLSIFFISFFSFRYFFFKKIFSIFSFFSLKKQENISIEDIDKFFIIKKDNSDLNDAVFNYLILESLSNDSNIPKLQNIISNNINFLDIDRFYSLFSKFGSDFFYNNNILNRLFDFHEKNTYGVILKFIICQYNKNTITHKQRINIFNSIVSNFDYFISQSIIFHHHSFYIPTNYPLFLKFLFDFSLEEQKIILDRFNNYLLDMKDKKINLTLLKIHKKLEKNILKYEIKNF